MTREELHTITWGDYNIRVRAWQRENLRRWELLRFKIFKDMQANPNIEEFYRPRKPQDVFPLPTDDEIEEKKVKVKEMFEKSYLSNIEKITGMKIIRTK